MFSLNVAVHVLLINYILYHVLTFLIGLTFWWLMNLSTTDYSETLNMMSGIAFVSSYQSLCSILPVSSAVPLTLKGISCHILVTGPSYNDHFSCLWCHMFVHFAQTSASLPLWKSMHCHVFAQLTDLCDSFGQTRKLKRVPSPPVF